MGESPQWYCGPNQLRFGQVLRVPDLSCNCVPHAQRLSWQPVPPPRQCDLPFHWVRLGLSIFDSGLDLDQTQSVRTNTKSGVEFFFNVNHKATFPPLIITKARNGVYSHSNIRARATSTKVLWTHATSNCSWRADLLRVCAEC